MCVMWDHFEMLRVATQCPARKWPPLRCHGEDLEWRPDDEGSLVRSRPSRTSRTPIQKSTGLAEISHEVL